MVSLLYCCFVDLNGELGSLLTPEITYKDEDRKRRTNVAKADIYPKINLVCENHSFYEVVKTNLHPKAKKYVRLAMSVYINHFIVSNWNKHSVYDLETFSYRFSLLLKENIEFIPNPTQKGRCRITSKDWIKSFSTISGLNMSLKDWNYRGRYSELIMDLIIEDLINHYEEIAENFDLLIRDIIDYVTNNQNVYGWKWIGESEENWMVLFK